MHKEDGIREGWMMKTRLPRSKCKRTSNNRPLAVIPVSMSMSTEIAEEEVTADEIEDS